MPRLFLYKIRPEGFEPPTSWSVARHSIQLSYGRTKLATNSLKALLHTTVKTIPTHPPSSALEDHRFSRGDFGVGVGGQGDPIEAYTRTPIEGRPQSRHRPTPKAPAKSAHDRTRTCTPFPTPVPQTGLSTNSSTWANTLPSHTRIHARGGTRTLTRLTPTGS